MVPKHYFEKRIVKKGLQADSASPSLNLPVIPTFRDIANLLECVAMSYLGSPSLSSFSPSGNDFFCVRCICRGNLRQDGLF